MSAHHYSADQFEHVAGPVRVQAQRAIKIDAALDKRIGDQRKQSSPESSPSGRNHEVKITVSFFNEPFNALDKIGSSRLSRR
jgi:hypothetical protein